MPKAKMKRKGAPASAIEDLNGSSDLVRYDQDTSSQNISPK